MGTRQAVTSSGRSQTPFSTDAIQDSSLPEIVERARAKAFEYVFDAVVVTDLDGYIVDWNYGSERLYGYSRDEALGQLVSILHVPEDSEDLAAEVIGAVQRDGRWQGEIRMLHKDGHIGWIESMCVPLFNDSEEPVGTLGINRDISERMEAEESLRTAEARFRSLVENSLVGIYIVSGDRLAYANPRLAEMFGFSPEDMLSDVRIFDLVVEEDREMVRTNVGRRLAGENLQEPYTFRARRKDGKLIHVQVHGGRIDLDGEYAVIGMARDVTAERRAEERLRASEERLAMVVRAVDDVIREWEVETGAIVWSENAHRAFRYPAEGMNASIDWWYGRIHPEDRDRIITGLHGLLEGTEEFWSDEYRFRRGDGTYATILDRVYVRRDERAAPLKAVGSMMDVTDRRRDEDAQRFLSRASAALDSSLDPDITLPKLARLLVPAYADLCRIDLAEEGGGFRCAAVAHASPATERHLSEADPFGTDRPGRASPLAQSLQMGNSLLVHAADGGAPERLGDAGPARDFWSQLELRSLVVMPLVAQDRVLGALMLGMAGSGRRYGPPEMLLAEDLARRTAVALENARLYTVAQQAIQAREEILSIVSHDLRNPLSTIRMGADLLAGPAQERREENRKWLATILRATDQLNRLIEDLMDAARIDTGGFSVEPADHAVPALFEEIGDIFGPLAKERGIDLECSVEEGLSTIWLDAPQIQRVLSNLIGNAIKFTPEGGSITVRAAGDGDDIAFSVSDTGPGIPPEELSHVFDRYWQAREGDRRGMGLGLAIAKGIVIAHSGRIWAESGKEGGATFHFTVPVARTTERG